MWPGRKNRERAPDLRIREALENIFLPDRQESARSCLSGLEIGEDGKARVVLEVNSSTDPGVLEDFRRKVEDTLSELPGLSGTRVILTAAKPKTPQSAPSRPAPSPVPGVRHIVAVASGKGGVGKSTLAVNLALSLQAEGFKTGLMDADIYGPSVRMLLGMGSERPALKDDKLIPPEAFGLKTMSMAFLNPEEAPVIWRGPMIQGAIRQFLHDVDWAPLDILIVDMPPGTGDAQLSLVQKAPLSGAVIVSTPQDIALIDARKGLGMFRKVGVPILGLVENMSWHCCPNCGHRSEIFGHGGARAEAEHLDYPFLGEIPLDRGIRECSDAGTPAVLQNPDAPYAQTLRDIARKIGNSLES